MGIFINRFGEKWIFLWIVLVVKGSNCVVILIDINFFNIEDDFDLYLWLIGDFN